tara:strand:- start:41 stop:505 length:465 start_codon:yes stop_codon:yes gene_type:complete
MKKILSSSLAILLTFTFLNTLEANPKKTTCLVSGEEISISNAESINYKGGKLYFCCPGCSSDFASNAEQYTAAANFQLVMTNQYVQKTCPATGRKIKNMTGKKAKIVQVNGEDIALCCGGCYKKTTKMAEKKRMNYLFSDKSFKKGYVLASSQK